MSLVVSSLMLVKEFAETLLEGVRDNIKNKSVTPFGSMDTTGEAADSLFFKITDSGLVFGSTWAYINVLEDGRRPGKFAPPELIRKWIDDKPLGTDIPRDSLAFLINRKISEEGSLLYRQGGESGILSDYFNQEYVHKFLTTPLKQAVIDEVTDILFKR